MLKHVQESQNFFYFFFIHEIIARKYKIRVEIKFNVCKKKIFFVSFHYPYKSFDGIVNFKLKFVLEKN